MAFPNFPLKNNNKFENSEQLSILHQNIRHLPYRLNLLSMIQYYKEIQPVSIVLREHKMLVAEISHFKVHNMLV